MTPRYLLAKYVPDLSRMEPRNIGVFLWANGQIASRFLSKGEVPFVGDTEAYEWWVTSWQDAIAGDQIKPRRGKAIPKDDSKCLDALLTNQEENYLLVDAGELLEPIGRRELSEAVGFLFSELVAHSQMYHTAEGAPKVSEGLRDYCKHIFEATGLSRREDYQEGFPIECPIYGVKKHLKFNHAFVNGSVNAVFQQTNLRQQQSVNSSALMLHHVTENAIVAKTRCAALARESDIHSEAGEEALEFLQAVSRVIFVDQDDADEQLMDVVLNGGHAKRSKRT